eukprot:PhM_4_TR9569/c1_g1_i1/m.38186/K01110/PTEN; phosphatidylinositol-3,4,5-trisphosphate 3-phosphatase and dual-specificity protein phosphatase PTEN
MSTAPQSKGNFLRFEESTTDDDDDDDNNTTDREEVQELVGGESDDDGEHIKKKHFVDPLDEEDVLANTHNSSTNSSSRRSSRSVDVHGLMLRTKERASSTMHASPTSPTFARLRRLEEKHPGSQSSNSGVAPFVQQQLQQQQQQQQVSSSGSGDTPPVININSASTLTTGTATPSTAISSGTPRASALAKQAGGGLTTTTTTSKRKISFASTPVVDEDVSHSQQQQQNNSTTTTTSCSPAGSPSSYALAAPSNNDAASTSVFSGWQPGSPAAHPASNISPPLPSPMLVIPTRGKLWKYSTGSGLWGAKNWRERFFIAEREGLAYYAKESDDKPKGIVYWDCITDVYTDVGPAQHPAATGAGGIYFGVSFHRRGASEEYMLLLKASNGDDRDGWLCAIATYVPLAMQRLLAEEEDDDDDAIDPVMMLGLTVGVGGDSNSQNNITNNNSSAASPTASDLSGSLMLGYSSPSTRRRMSLASTTTQVGGSTTPLLASSPSASSSPMAALADDVTRRRSLSERIADAASNITQVAVKCVATRLVDASSKLREAVSKKKLRFKKDGFDLDLVYVTERIIAMGYPARGREAVYRNKREDVEAFLKFYHDGHFKVFNLCAERSYDASTFGGHFSHYPFCDHNPPPLSLFHRMLEDIHAFLCSDPKNVVAVHCKAGKGRTGCVIAAYLATLSVDHPDLTWIDALRLFGEKRTRNGKGVTIASQQRYVRYCCHLARELKWSIPSRPLQALSVQLTAIPANELFSSVFLVISNQHGVVVFDSREAPRQFEQEQQQLHQHQHLAAGGHVTLSSNASPVSAPDTSFASCSTTSVVDEHIDETGDDIVIITRKKRFLVSMELATVTPGIVIDGDCHFELFASNPVGAARRVCGFWMHTVMLERDMAVRPVGGAASPPTATLTAGSTSTASASILTLELLKCDLDDVNKDKEQRIVPDTFAMRVRFCEAPGGKPVFTKHNTTTAAHSSNPTSSPNTTNSSSSPNSASFLPAALSKKLAEFRL